MADNVVNIGRTWEKQSVRKAPQPQPTQARRSPRRVLFCGNPLTSILETSILRREVASNQPDKRSASVRVPKSAWLFHAQRPLLPETNAVQIDGGLIPINDSFIGALTIVLSALRRASTKSHAAGTSPHRLAFKEESSIQNICTPGLRFMQCKEMETAECHQP